MSRYSHDPRVGFNADGSATIPEPVNGDWEVRFEAGCWVGHNAEQGYLHDAYDASRRAGYDTADEVIEHIVGAPQVAV